MLLIQIKTCYESIGYLVIGADTWNYSLVICRLIRLFLNPQATKVHANIGQLI